MTTTPTPTPNDPRPQPSFEIKFYGVMALAVLVGLVVGLFINPSWLPLAAGGVVVAGIGYAGDTGLLPGDQRQKLKAWKARQK